MDVDPIKIVMETEEHFGIVIPDVTAVRILTVGDLYLYVLQKTRRSTAHGCPTSRAFYRLRQTLCRDFGAERKQVGPSKLLRELFSPDQRAIVWPQLATRLDLGELPDPDPEIAGPTASAFVRWLACVTGSALVLCAVFLLFMPPIGPGRVPLILAVTITVWLSAVLLV
jgi:hypothetical protein